MGLRTDTDLRKLFIYQVYLRNHTKGGTIQEFIMDLDRIKALGVDMIYLLPIHEIGQKQKKGDLGCPYSIKDYRSINHEYGTLEDFKDLIEKTHQKGMKLMIDVVYNHTSYDSVLLEKHPEYFYKKNGEFSNRVGDWWDITDLDYSVDKELWHELIDTLVYWTKLGVDGFRWDVASLLPYEFLKKAHEAVMKVNPNSVFLSESVHGSFLRYIRNEGFGALSESEIYHIFDIAYDYDTHPYFEKYLKNEGSLNRYLEEVLRQEEVYPENYIKLRNLENHDFGRFTKMVNNNSLKVDNWTAQMFFNKGCKMIYAGQERSDLNKPSLFDIDKVNWDGRDVSPLISKLGKIAKEEAVISGVFNIHFQEKDVVVASYELDDKKIVGIFNVGNEKGKVGIKIPNGKYQDLLNDVVIEVKDNNILLEDNPVIFWVN